MPRSHNCLLSGMARASAVAMLSPEPGSRATASPHHSHSLPRLAWPWARGLLSLWWVCGPLEITGSSRAPRAQPSCPVEGLSCKPVAGRQHWDLWQPIPGSSHPLPNALPFTHVLDTGMVQAPHQGEARALRSWERACCYTWQDKGEAMLFNWCWVGWVHPHHFFEALQRCALCRWVVGHAPEMGTHRLWWQPEPPLLHESSPTPHLCNSPNHLLLHHHHLVMVLEVSCLLCCFHQIVRCSLHRIASSLQQGRGGAAA